MMADVIDIRDACRNCAGTGYIPCDGRSPQADPAGWRRRIRERRASPAGQGLPLVMVRCSVCARFDGPKPPPELPDDWGTKPPPF